MLTIFVFIIELQKLIIVHYVKYIFLMENTVSGGGRIMKCMTSEK